MIVKLNQRNYEMKCIYCEKDACTSKYLHTPGFIIVPNIYDLCEDHKGITLEFKDLYNDDGSRKDYPLPVKYTNQNTKHD